MNLSSNPPITLQSLHELLSILSDVFCKQTCKKCNWSTADFYFHLHNPGHLTQAEKRKVNKAIRRLLANTLSQVPQIASKDNHT